MQPSTTDEELLADFLLEWEESGRLDSVNQEAERIAAGHPHLIGELKFRMGQLSQMAWLDEPVLDHSLTGKEEAYPHELVAGRYILLKMLATGLGGSVYHARDSELGREVAIKVSRTTDRLAAAHLLHEGKCASRLKHPSIVPVFDVGRDKNLVFLVYEFVAGINLSRKIARGAVAWREALEITRQVVMAVSHAHESGLVHRDIKPANILVDQAGRVRLADFGSAAPIGHLAVFDSLGAGSVAYTPPEVLRGQEASPATDMYAIGMVLYSMLNGRLVGNNLALPMLRNSILSCEEWDLQLSDALPKSVISLCRGMIIKDPLRRMTDHAVILKLIGKALEPVRYRVPATFIPLGLLISAVAAGWWNFGNLTKQKSPDVPFGFQHEPSVDGTIGGGVLKLPVGLAFAPDGTMVVANAAKGNICRFRRDGGLVQVFGKRGSGNQFLFYPHGVACGADGKVYVSDHGNHVVHCYSPDGELLRSVGGYGTAPGRFMEPHGLAFDEKGFFYVGDHGNKRIQVFDQSLNLKSILNLAERAILEIVGVLVDKSGRLLVSDTAGGCVRVFSKQGDDLGKMSTGPDFKPLWLAQDPLGQVWVGDAQKHVVVFDSHLKQVRLKGLDKRLSFYPQGIAFGPKGELAVVNYSEGRVVFIRDIPEAEPESGAGEKSSPAEKGR